jgi:large subunit ribosomal protein L22
MEAQATAKYVRMAPRKVRFVLDTIRGKYAQDALDQLKFTPNHAADEIANVLRSAMANAENNHNMDADYLKVARCFVDPGPTLKRVQPRAQGRAYRILKRTSHITIVVEEGEAPPTTRPREAEIKRKGKKPPLRAALPSPVNAPVAPADEATAAPADEETTTAATATDEQVTAAVTEADETTPIPESELPTGTDQAEAAVEAAAGSGDDAEKTG